MFQALKTLHSSRISSTCTNPESKSLTLHLKHDVAIIYTIFLLLTWCLSGVNAAGDNKDVTHLSLCAALFLLSLPSGWESDGLFVAAKRRWEKEPVKFWHRFVRTQTTCGSLIKTLLVYLYFRCQFSSFMLNYLWTDWRRVNKFK